MTENSYYAYAYTDLDGEIRTTEQELRIPAWGDAPWVQAAVDGLHEHVHIDRNGEVGAPGPIVPVLVVERGA